MPVQMFGQMFCGIACVGRIQCLLGISSSLDLLVVFYFFRTLVFLFASQIPFHCTFLKWGCIWLAVMVHVCNPSPEAKQIISCELAELNWELAQWVKCLLCKPGICAQNLGDS